MKKILTLAVVAALLATTACTGENPTSTQTTEVSLNSDGSVDTVVETTTVPDE